jgi:HK97 gp10 family phage protein
MKSSFGDLSINFKNTINKFSEKLSARAKQWEVDNVRKMNSAVDIVYRAARAKRPMINVVGSGLMPIQVKGSKKKLEALKVRRVSNPAAIFGVPVRTGNLQSAIKKSVAVQFNKIIGKVWVDQKMAPYAKYVEYGTSKMAPRPFFRQAKDLNEKTVREIIGRGYKQ